MPVFGRRSKANLLQLHPELQRVANAAIERVDFTITCGCRCKKDQEEAVLTKASRAHFGESPHNYFPAVAFDFVPYPFNFETGWKDIDRFAHVAAVIKEEAERLGVPVAWGGDWPNFKDYPHIQLEPWRNFKGRLFT